MSLDSNEAYTLHVKIGGSGYDVTVHVVDDEDISCEAVVFSVSWAPAEVTNCITSPLTTWKSTKAYIW
ncbi:hypothetical protein Bhyg_03955 [Pseudolycoriella hygida]|uniref:Uncharacterized protein n=1 Tax=Pseudolycoriella hygida TaxID=35572 RepID=A0A9Q0NFS0_9DIPT|nr:hypothetical protein Bhyg_03955 [Pseudolycoriella hygida]